MKRIITETQDEAKKSELPLLQQLKSINDAFLEDLIPVLNAFESQIKNLPATVESNDRSDDFVEFTESVQLAQIQLLDLLKHYGLNPIETSLGAIFNPVHHEEIQPATYSDDIPAGKIIREDQRGYLLHDQVIRKAQVVVSKGRDIWTSERLDWIVGRYIDRLMFEFQNKYQLNNIDKAFVKLKMVQYMMELDSEAVGAIDAFAVMDERPGGHPELYANYCVGPEQTHLCTDVFRNFWDRMWQVVEQSRRIPESFDEPDQSSIDQPTPMLKIEIERPQEPPQLKNIKWTPKAAEPRPGTSGYPLVPESQRIPLDKSIRVMVPEPVEEMIDTSPPISIDITGSLDTYAKDLKPDTRKTVEVGCDPLYESIDLIIPKPAKKVVDSRLPKAKNSLKILNLQTQVLTPGPPPIETDPDSLETVNSNADSTLPGDEDILREQIQNLRPDTFEPEVVTYPAIALDNTTPETPQRPEDILHEQVQNLMPDTSEPENRNNVTQQPTPETGVDGEIPIESTTLTRSDSSAEIDRDTRQIKVQDSSENKVENRKKSFGDYLSQGGRFVVEKIKVIIFRKPSS